MAVSWRNAAPIASIVIALAAAAFTGLQWLETRDQAFLTTKPHVNFDIENDPDQPTVGIAITNAGPGPASIKAITFYVDRKPVADADQMGQSYAKLSPAELDYQIMEPDDTLAVGERVWLISYRKPRGGKINQANKSGFADFIEKSAAIEVEFCSVIREHACWTKCSDKGRCR
jgi:hypothetical protein